MKRLLAPLAALTLVLAGAAPAQAGGSDRATLHRYAADTWRSMVAMVDPATALPADNIEGSLDPSTRSAYTSPTNIGGYLWSAVAARDLGLISRREAASRVVETLETLGELDRHEQSGMFYNWYDPHTKEVVLIWPENGATITPFMSSVDNGWLASARMDPGGYPSDVEGSNFDPGFGDCRPTGPEPRTGTAW